MSGAAGFHGPGVHETDRGNPGLWALCLAAVLLGHVGVGLLLLQTSVTVEPPGVAIPLEMTPPLPEVEPPAPAPEPQVAEAPPPPTVQPPPPEVVPPDQPPPPEPPPPEPPPPEVVPPEPPPASPRSRR